MTTLGERIRELREDRDQSLRELARSLDVSAAFLSDVELGRRFPNDEMLVKIAKKLRVSADDLRAHDSRPPLEELKRIASSNPAYGFAFRRIVDGIVDDELQPDELLAMFAVRRKKRGKR